MPLQTNVNTSLRNKLGVPQTASLVNFAVALIPLGLITFIIDGNLLIPWGKIAQQPVWIWSGGVLGAIYVTSNILLLPRLGSVATVVLPALGQVLMGMLVDQFGLFGSLRIENGFLRVTGAVLVLAGVFMIVASGADKDAGGKFSMKTFSGWFWAILGIVIGMLVACQTAINTELGRVIGSSQKAALISFLTGTATLLILYIIFRIKNRGRMPAREKPAWWMYLGGFMGAIFVLLTIYIATDIGTGMAVIVMLVGMIIGSMIIDALGIMGVERRRITTMKICGALIMIGGACMTYLL